MINQDRQDKKSSNILFILFILSKNKFMLRVKICGITRLDDALLACELGADAIGFIFYKKSPRYIIPDEAMAIAEQLPPYVARVGVFVDTPRDDIVTYREQIKLTAIQFHGMYSLSELEQFDREHVIAVVRVAESFQVSQLAQFRNCATAILLDTHRKGLYGGTGETFDWQAAIDAKAYGRIILAGGLTPDNVQQAAETVAPYALDVSSGVEAHPGKKDPAKLRQLFRNIRDSRVAWQPGSTPCFPLA
jgi:phosphoribosylanthranilate isomerase